MTYFILINSEKVGPLSLDDLKNYSITPETYIWKEGLPQWVKAQTLPELNGLIIQQPPQPPFSQPYAAAPQQQSTFAVQPKTWLVESILVTLFCCLPFGIVGIVNACKVDTLFSAGQIQAAQKASAQAKKWTIISFFVGIAVIVIYIISMIVFAFMDSAISSEMIY